ncbi:hypothetical protein [Vibrio barjaei]|uniref:hypothetical protein n=1 Tax=Vibrio barjaei TaxID=1676683 RepID=UPI002284F1D5|nr:hypothetical protein [Vibrio barjaei]MCY9874603.1 hypothetical protein [Vibrio barjaei]
MYNVKLAIRRVNHLKFECDCLKADIKKHIDSTNNKFEEGQTFEEVLKIVEEAGCDGDDLLTRHISYIFSGKNSTLDGLGLCQLKAYLSESILDQVD